MKFHPVILLVFDIKGEFYFTGFGKLGAIAHQVYQYLAKPARVPFDTGGNLVTDPAEYFNRSASNPGTNQFANIIGGDFRIKVNRFEIQLAGLHLGKIEDVVD